MNWKDFLPNFRVKASAVTKMVVSVFNGQPVWTPRDYEALSKEAYQQNVWVFRCVMAIAQAVAGVDWVLYQTQGKNKKNKKELEDHALLDLLYKPNEFQSKQEFMESLVAFYLLSGNSYIEQNGPNTGPPLEMFTLRPDRIQIIPDSKNLVKGYLYKMGDTEYPFDVKKVMHLKDFHPTDDLYGLSRIEVAAMAADNDNAASTWNNALLNNGARPTGAMSSEGFLSDPQYNKLKEEINIQYKGAKNAGRPMLLEGGLKWQEMGLSPRDMDFIQSKKMSRVEICAAFGTPPEIVGDKEHATYSNYKEARKAFYIETVLPILDKVRDKMNAHLVPKYGENLYLDYDKDSIEALQEDEDARAERVRKDVAGGLITRKEGREATGYEADDKDDVFYIPGTTMVLARDNKILINPKPAAPEEPTPGEPAEGKKGHFFNVKAFNLETDEQKLMFWKSMDKRRESYYKSVTEQVAKHFKTERESVVKAFEGKGLEGALKAIDGTKKDLKTLLTAIDTMVIEDFGNETFNSLKMDAGQLEEKGLLDYFNVFAAAVQTFIKTTVANKVVQITDTTKKAIKNITDQGQTDGLSIPKIAAKIDELYLEQIIPNRSTVIARTEVISSSNAGNRFAAQQTELPLTKEWLSTPDERTRDGHEEANGQIKDFDEPYEVMGEELMFPGDPAGSAENVIQCRCTEVYKVKK